MTTFCYHAFGIIINSDIELPMLNNTATHSKADLMIRQKEVNAKGLLNPKTVLLHCQMAPNQLWLNIPNVARFLVLEGNTIHYQLDSAEHLTLAGLLLTSTVLSAALHQQGNIVLRATAIKMGHKAVLFSSPYGGGKSLLAAAMHKKNYDIISDDLCVIDKQGKVQPGLPYLKIWRDCFKVLEISAQQLQSIRPNIEKYYYPLDKHFHNQATDIAAIYLLSSSNVDAPEITHLHGMEKLMPLRSQVCHLQYLDGLGLMESASKQLMMLANHIHIAHLIRPHPYKVAHWINCIETDTANHLGGTA